MEGRGRPAQSGPLDGAGRRSIYLGVRRNFLAPFMLTFDTPIPFATVGRRAISNVPAQALILMNDPFVQEQAGLWARRVVGKDGSAEDRLRMMYASAFGRPPTVDEAAMCRTFLQPPYSPPAGPGPAAGAGELGVWTDLAHALFNAKEFIYLH